MRELPYLKLSFMFYPLLSLFLFSIISCSYIDLSKIIPTNPEKQPSSENGGEFSSTDEKQRNMAPLPNHLEDESEINENLILTKNINLNSGEVETYIYDKKTQGITNISYFYCKKNK